MHCDKSHPPDLCNVWRLVVCSLRGRFNHHRRWAVGDPGQEAGPHSVSQRPPSQQYSWSRFDCSRQATSGAFSEDFSWWATSKDLRRVSEKTNQGRFKQLYGSSARVVCTVWKYLHSRSRAARIWNGMKETRYTYSSFVHTYNLFFAHTHDDDLLATEKDVIFWEIILYYDEIMI